MKREILGVDLNKRIDDEIKRLQLVKEQFDDFGARRANGENHDILFNGEYDELINEMTNIEDALERDSINQYLKGRYWEMQELSAIKRMKNKKLGDQ